MSFYDKWSAKQLKEYIERRQVQLEGAEEAAGAAMSKVDEMRRDIAEATYALLEKAKLST